MDLQVIKKDCNIEAWDPIKIKRAITKSADRANVTLTKDDKNAVVGMVVGDISNKKLINVKELHDIVERKLRLISPDAALSYAEYRQYRKEVVKTWDKIYKQTQDTLYKGDRENANFNSSLTSTKGSLVRGYLTKDLYRKFYLSKDEVSAIDDGYIYIHDLRDLVFDGINCCLFDMGNVLNEGFEMAGVRYKDPRSVVAALQVIGDVTLVATAQQFGGFTIPELDKLLVPYVIKTYEGYLDDARRWGTWTTDSAKEYARYKTLRDIRQGLQGLEMKLNTVPSSRGDTAFVTTTFGNVDGTVDSNWQREICHAILDVRADGQSNGSPVVFPKLVYLHSEAQHQYHNQQALFDHAIKCSSRCMYPDFLSLDNSEVGDIFNSTGKVISPMGCRAYLSPWKNETGETVFTGRANIGAVSLNLPMIYMKAQEEGHEFLDEINKYLAMIRKFLSKRYGAIANNLASTNPVAFTQGGLYGGYRKPDEKIGDLVNSFTASFGITSLNELNVLMEGKELHESDRKAINKVIDYIDSVVNQYKVEDGYLYALYATPAESLAGTQLQQFRAKYGIIPKVSDKEYFSNGFHCPVTADITPFEKQDMEHELFHKINGGHIQYVRLENRDNLAALKTIIKRGMRMGFYQGVNFDLVVCEDCGNRPQTFSERCEECGSTNITVTSRVCGYLGIQYSNGNTRFNDSKLAEVKDRVSM